MCVTVTLRSPVTVRSWAPVTVTVWAVSQFAVVNVNDAGLTVAAAVSLLSVVTVTFPAGCVSSTTV